MDTDTYDRSKERLREAARAYYTDGTSGMSDADYDALLADVARHEQDNEITEDVAAEAVAAGAALGGDVRHPTKMLSLDNVYSEPDLRSWWKSLDGGSQPHMVVEPKLDGLAMCIRYQDGYPVQMVTRGDGSSGEDTTLAMPLLTNLPLQVPNFTGEVRGEVIFSNEQFAAADAARTASGKDSFANPRNAAAGTVNRASKGGDVPQGTELSFIAYALVADDSGLDFSTHSAAMGWLADQGFDVAMRLLPDVLLGSYSAALTRDADLVRPEIGFELDGLVFKVDDLALQHELGSSSRAPRWARAYKFPSVVARTELVDVLWQVGRTGSVTPRAVVKPVRVGGTTVTYATLNNPGDIERKDLRIGDTVEIRRAAEVIPEIVGPVAQLRDGNEFKIASPTQCPNCGEALDDSQARLRCPSGGECALDRKLVYAASRDALDIEGLSTSLVEALMQSGAVSDLADLFELTQSKIATTATGRLTKDGAPIAVGDAIATKVFDQIAKATEEATFDRVLIALGLTGTGRSMSRRLAQHFGSMDAVLAASETDFEAVDKMGPIKAASLHRQLHAPAMQRTIGKLRAQGLAMELATVSSDAPQPLSGMSIVVTGTMHKLGSRSEVTGNLEALGASVGSSVSAKTTLVVTDDPEGSSSKLVKARKLGVEILDEESFIQRYQI